MNWTSSVSGDNWAFDAAAGLGSRLANDVEGGTSSADADAHIYWGAYMAQENGERTSGQKLVESYTGSNLHVLVATSASRIRFDSGGAAGVRAVSVDATSTVYNTYGSEEISLQIMLAENAGELLLGANVYNTPALLQKSGVGPTAALEALGIDPVVPASAATQQIGENYWNLIYIQRIYSSVFPSLSLPAVVLNAAEIMEILPSKTMGSRSIFFRRGSVHGREVALRVDVGTSISAGSAKMKLGTDPECSAAQVGFTGNIRATHDSLRPNVTSNWDANPEGYVRTAIDCYQFYFFTMWLPMHRAFSEAAVSGSAGFFNSSVELYFGSRYPTLVSAILAAGEPTLGSSAVIDNSTPRWASNVDLFAATLAVHAEKTQIQLSGGYTGLDSIHYGGTAALGTVLESNTSLVHGTSNVRVCDLSAYPEPVPGNTVAAAYTMGRFVARRALGLQPDYRSSDGIELSRKKWLADYTKAQFVAEIKDGFDLLYFSDGSNIEQDFKSTLPTAHQFEYDREERALCGTTANYQNEFLISEAEFVDFELLFWVKIPDGLNSGMQVRSAMLDSDTAKLYGPQIEIDNKDFGAIYSEATGHGWLLDPAARSNVSAANWNSSGWNAYRVLVQGGTFTVQVNGVQVAELAYTFDSHVWSQLSSAVAINRIGFQVHSPYQATQIGQRVCFKHVLVKRI